MREELRVQIEATQHRLVKAVDSERSEWVRVHRARLEDLIDIAARYGIDVTEWVDRILLNDTREDAAATSDGSPR